MDRNDAMHDDARWKQNKTLTCGKRSSVESMERLQVLMLALVAFTFSWQRGWKLARQSHGCSQIEKNMYEWHRLQYETTGSHTTYNWATLVPNSDSHYFSASILYTVKLRSNRAFISIWLIISWLSRPHKIYIIDIGLW